MTDLNNLSLVGRLTKDAELTIKGTKSIAKFSIAVNRERKTADGKYESVPSYFDLAVFDKYAEKITAYLKKGTLIAITGHVVQDRWEKDGQKHSQVRIVVDQLELLSSAKSQETDQSAAENVAQETSSFTPVPPEAESNAATYDLF